MIVERIGANLWMVRGIVRGIRVARVVSATSRHAAHDIVIDALLGPKR